VSPGNVVFAIAIEVADSYIRPIRGRGPSAYLLGYKKGSLRGLSEPQRSTAPSQNIGEAVTVKIKRDDVSPIHARDPLAEF
jgi:hypothetical protein